jgi:M6 family metalloprotease-like protein
MTTGRRITCIAMAAALGFGLTVAPTQASTTKFTSCDQMHKVYQYGISVSSKAQARAVREGLYKPPVKAKAYEQNRRLDRDRDGVICAVKKPTASTPGDAQPSQEAYVAPTSSSAAVSECQVLDRSYERRTYAMGLAAGFPTPAEPLKRSGGVLRMALIPIDWADLPGEPDPLSRVRDQMQLVTDWYDMVSDGRIKVEWVPYDGWVRMPGSSADYSIAQSSNYGIVPKFGRDAVAAADPVFDFTNVDGVHLLLPKSQNILPVTAQAFPNSLQGTDPGGYATQEGRISYFTAVGRYFDEAPATYWSYWAHETGHFLQMAHIGSSYRWSDMHGYDLMGSQDGPFRTLSSWLRFVKRWLNDDQIYCQPLATVSPTTVMLNPVDNRTTGVKSILIPTSATSVVVVESRRSSRFDSGTSAPKSGVLVYIYDATRGNQEDDWLKPAYPAGRAKFPGVFSRLPPMTDALLQPGDSVTAQGVKVTVTKSGTYDTVTIEHG